MSDYKKKKNKFKEQVALKEEQMNSDELNLFDNKKPQETTPAIEQPQDDDNPQLDNMPVDDKLDLNTGGDTLPDTLVEVDIDGDIYEAKMNKGDDTITLKLKDRDESAGDKMNLVDNTPDAMNLDNQNTTPNMETPDMPKMENVQDPFKNKEIIFEGAEDDDNFFDDDATDETAVEPTDDVPSENPADELPVDENPIDDSSIDELPIDDSNVESSDINLDSEIEQTAAEKIGEVIETVIEDKVAEAVGETESNDDDEWSDEEFDDFEWDDEEFENLDETPEESVDDESKLGGADNPLLDMESTDQEEPGLNNISKAMSEIKKLKNNEKKYQKYISQLVSENKQFKGTLSEIQLFTEKVGAVAEIDKLTNISEQDKMNMKSLIQNCKNAVEIKTVLTTIGTLKESMSKKFNNVKDTLKDHNISPKLREIVESIKNTNPEIIKEQTERDRMADLAGV
jgi:hypothetical protein